MWPNAYRVLAFSAVYILLDGVVYSDYGLDSTTLPMEIIDDNSTEVRVAVGSCPLTSEGMHFKRSGNHINEETRSERNCCIRNHCFTFIMCTALIAMPLFVTVAIAATLIVYILKVRKRKNINPQKCKINDAKTIKMLKPINTDATCRSSSSNSSPPSKKASGNSDGQLRPLRNLCDESELSRSIMPSSSSDQEPDERTLNDESPFPK